MNNSLWHVTFKILRQIQGEKPFFESFELDVDPDEYVLDGIERVWAFHDRTLSYRHACHHSTCGACGMRINGVEKLTCITPICEVTKNGGVIQVEPLRNFPVISDLVVDISGLFKKIEQAHLSQISPVETACLPHEKTLSGNSGNYERLIDCIECGLCVSACPSALTTPAYLGPAALAAAHQSYVNAPQADLLLLVDHQDGLWRCHSAYECTAVCPSNVDPAQRIMSMRRTVITKKFQSIFKTSEKLT